VRRRVRRRQPCARRRNQRRGLELETRAGTELLPIPALLPEEVDAPADLVVVFTKTFHTDAALAGIAAAIGPRTWLLSLQNGLGNDRRLAGHASEDAFSSAPVRCPRTSSARERYAAMAKAVRSSTLPSARTPRSPGRSATF
jgi:2-dehydropantoate 2-reductase